jgi:hypothetical protein
LDNNYQKVLNQAMICGFTFKQDSNGNWHIDPKTDNERWKLKLVDNRWLLFSGDIPQINFSIDEAIAFLERQNER